MEYLPTANWQWVYDHEQGKLSVVDRDRSFPLAYPKKMLTLKATQIIPFTIDTVARYIQLFESGSLRKFDDTLRCKVILHLLAIDLFHKPIMPKSWLFAAAEQNTKVYNEGDIVSITASGMSAPANYMVLEQEGDFCLCLLIDKMQTLPNGNVFEQFQLIKVTTDKLTSREALL